MLFGTSIRRGLEPRGSPLRDARLVVSHAAAREDSGPLGSRRIFRGLRASAAAGRALPGRSAPRRNHRRGGVAGVGMARFGPRRMPRHDSSSRWRRSWREFRSPLHFELRSGEKAPPDRFPEISRPFGTQGASPAFLSRASLARSLGVRSFFSSPRAGGVRHILKTPRCRPSRS